MPYESERASVTLALCGDIMPSRRLAMHREPEFLKLREILCAADATFANLESMVIRYGEGHPAVRIGTHMVTEPELLEDLKWFGFKMLSCANSHSLNFGETGLLLQNQYLDSAGIIHAGTGENLRQASSPAYLDTPRGRIALIASSAHLPGTNSRASHQRVDFPGKPGVNALGSRATFVVDRESFDSLKKIGSRLGFDAERQRVVDHGFHAPSEIGVAGDIEYEFQGHRYLLGEAFDIKTEYNLEDAEENLRQIREAKRQADWVIMSLHNQDMIGRSWLKAQRRVDIAEQPEFVVEFARRCIDAGADVFAAHGPHIFMGVEIYRGKPIFYSLGNFIFQNDTLKHMPATPYERFGLDAYATPSEFFDKRSANDTKGHAATPESLQSVVAVCEFNQRDLRQIKLYPVDLGFGRPRSQRGRPLLADAESGKRIVDRVGLLSKQYGTEIQNVDGHGVIHVK